MSGFPTLTGTSPTSYILVGATGEDRLYGLGGNDVYIVDRASDGEPTMAEKSESAKSVYTGALFPTNWQIKFYGWGVSHQIVQAREPMRNRCPTTTG